jgi:NAD(P)-dependent dehydrogenase (short-subunit alcohol dehydrogenase family)
MRTILITGATGKVGQVFVRHFLGIGDSVIGVSRSKQSLERLRSSLSTNSSNFHTLPVDLVAKDGVFKISETLLQLNLYPQYLINSARNPSYLSIESDAKVARDNFIGELTLDVVIPYELTQALVTSPQTQLRAVVNIGSQYGVVAPNLSLYKEPDYESPLHYGVAKAALSHLTKELAVRFARKRVRINCIAYGGVEGRVDGAFKKRYAELCPMGRMLTESELVGPVEMLLSDACSAITGETLVVDCGWSLW